MPTKWVKANINLLRSRPLRRTCSAYRPTSQPFSARHCRRENQLLGKRTFPKFFAFFAFCDVLCFFPRFFRYFTFFQLRVRVFTAVRFWFSFLCPEKNRVSYFCFLSFFSFVFSFFVTSDERGQGYEQAAVVLIAAAPQPTAIIQHHNNSSRKRARVFV